MSAYLKSTCLSSEDHNHNISNHMLHYLGCIRVSERARFFDESHPVWEKEIQHELGRIKNSASQESVNKRVRKRVHDKREKWRAECERDVRRFEFLRQTLDKSEDEAHFGENFNNSLKDWKDSTEYGYGIELVKRSGLNRIPGGPPPRPAPGPVPALQPEDSSIRHKGGYDPEKDLNVHIIRYKDSEDKLEDDYQTKGCESNDQPPAHVSKRQMPSERTKVEAILRNEPNNRMSQLRLGATGESLAYVHFPANNMSWIERAIARYYGQEPPDYDGIIRELQGAYKTETYMILRPQYWRGQMHGYTGSKPHARHMRPICEAISSNPNSVSQTPRNMVLFMPYLHWETDRWRSKFATEMDVLADKWYGDQEEEELEKKAERQERRKMLHPELNDESPSQTSTRESQQHPARTPAPTTSSRSKFVSGLLSIFGAHSEKHNRSLEAPRLDHCTSSVANQEPVPLSKRIQTMGSLVQGMNYGKTQKGLYIDEHGRIVLSPQNKKRKIGQLLLDAARLYEAMSSFRDRMVLKKYLYHDPPLHPRRTLDQAYYWTLNTTKSRDRDQVVYRATTAKEQDFHQLVDGKWREHEELGRKPCRICTSGIKKISRVVMVDQLWMWILDEKTIITSFPKRYGTQKHDHSGVHKAIRTKLDKARPNQIRSVFDLGLLVIDECSNTFFDRARTTDRQPQVIDQFSEAIGNVSRKETAAFERLYRWTDDASKIYRRPGSIDISELHVPLLDINPEAALHREIEDIGEELDIMIYVVRSHLVVLDNFIVHVQHMLDVDGLYGSNVSSREVGVTVSRTASADTSTGQMTTATVTATIPQQPMTTITTETTIPSDGSHPAEITTTTTTVEPEAVDVPKTTPPETQNTGQAPLPIAAQSLEARKHIHQFFKLNAKEVRNKIEWRIAELEHLRDSARGTCDGVQGLLALKQQQAGVVQAWLSLKQSEETIKQGRSIMLFTVVTIVFLPLTFTAAIFGMNALEFGAGGSLQLAEEFAFMFPISIAIIGITLTIAFSTWIRTFMWSIWHVAGYGLLTKTPLYLRWLDHGITSDHMFKHAVSVTGKLKDQVKEARLKRRTEDRKRMEDEITAHSRGGSSHGSTTRAGTPGGFTNGGAEHVEGGTTAAAPQNGNAHGKATKRRRWFPSFGGAGNQVLPR